MLRTHAGLVVLTLAGAAALAPWITLPAWATAWAAKDMKAYLAAYGKDFDPPGRMTRAAWEKEREARIVGKSKITVQVSDLNVSVNGNKATGFVQGFGLQRGAIGSTVCHDHHNIAVVGADYADMALAANRLGEIEGGFVVVRDGKVLAELALPVAGLMSLNPFEQVRDDLVDLRAAAASLGVTLEEPFLQLAFLALPVIPALKITDRGMVDVVKFEIIA